MENVLERDVFEEAKRVVTAEAVAGRGRAGNAAQKTGHRATRAEGGVVFPAQRADDGEIGEGNVAGRISRQRACRVSQASAAVTAGLGEFFTEVFEKIPG